MLTKDLSTAERVQPRFIEPMYAEAVRELPDSGLWSYEPKLDGYRCLAAKRNGGVVLWSRRGNGFVATTVGWMTGTGLFGFMQQNPMVWVGLIQAYLLMMIIAALLVLGSGQVNARKWNVVGALAHCAPLIAALSSLGVFESMGALGIVRVAITFHFVWLCLETFAALYPDPSHIC
jgi:hypothetical protein